MAAGAAPHVMVLPFPAQGHVTPFMELSHRLVDHGFQVTFVCTELIHALLLDTGTSGDALCGIRLVSVPDGMADGEDRRDLCKFVGAITRYVPGYVEDLIRDTEASGEKKVKWLIADVNLGFCFQGAMNLGVRVVAVLAVAASLGMWSSIPKMIEDGFIDDKGVAKREGVYEIAPKMPPICTSRMPWCIDGPPEGQQLVFKLVVTDNAQATSLAEIVVCNSFLGAEPAAFELFPEILPIGPLFADQELRKPVGQFWPEDLSCLEWLDAQPGGSVVYVAFGSFTIFDPRQFRELAEGLELTGRPFLWVVRPDFTSGGLSKAWFDEFQSRVAGKGTVVSWCPQQQVLAHPAVACFVSHCGWNSTMEGVRNGVPMLCWPYFADQFTNRSYICDIWRTGLAVTLGDGVVTKEEVKGKIAQVIGDEGIAERVGTLRDAARRSITEGGSSHENFSRFVGLLNE
ncbi:hypothetical protein ZWY2020_057915 [Hordeum vulgare]|nr:hypothetical protein ZWY2020_057915 [Hordeum vulgare]